MFSFSYTLFTSGVVVMESGPESAQTDFDAAVAYADSILGVDSGDDEDPPYARRVEVFDRLGACVYSTWAHHWPSASYRSDGLVRMYDMHRPDSEYIAGQFQL